MFNKSMNNNSVSLGLMNTNTNNELEMEPRKNVPYKQDV